jgi:hypothetical protein
MNNIHLLKNFKKNLGSGRGGGARRHGDSHWEEEEEGAAHEVNWRKRELHARR